MEFSILVKTLQFLRSAADELLIEGEFGGNELFRLKREIENLQDKLPEIDGVSERLATEILGIRVVLDKGTMEDQRNDISRFIMTLLHLERLKQVQNREAVSREIQRFREQIDHVLFLIGY